MPRFQALLTDYAWPNLHIEREIFAANDIELIVAEQSDAATLANLAVNADAIMTNWAKVPESVIAAAPRCRIVSRLGIGLDNIDVAAATRRKILVTNVPDYCLTEVAEHSLALILALGRKIAHYHLQTKQGVYDLQSGPEMRRIAGQTLGIVGLGNIGRCLVTKASAIGLKVIASSRRPREPVDGVEWVDFDDLLRRSDYISLHVPLTAETRHLLGAAQFAKMKPTAYLINTARGGLIDTSALADALAKGLIAGAGLDVQDTEPPDLTIAPYTDPRVIVTPHAAFVSIESLENLRSRAVKQVVDCFQGRTPESVCNPEVL
ncbi:MAG: C-terminal binding protein [Planctomycetota bacterium]|nr:C-terminal binding protein [Planctomycetota bacterium]